MMFTRRRGARAAHDTRALLAASAGQSVHGAEGIVRRAWAQELLRRQAHLQFARSAASTDCDTALGHLSAAQRDGDPHKISAAHAAVEQALEAIRHSTLACDQVRRTLRVELDLQARAAKQRAMTSLVRQLERDGPAITTSNERTSGKESRRSGRRLPWWPPRPITRRATDLRQS